jgi:hypothetical protein
MKALLAALLGAYQFIKFETHLESIPILSVLDQGKPSGRS